MKNCTKCNLEKELVLFSKNKNTKDGLFAHCKDCVKLKYIEEKPERSEKAKEWWVKNKENQKDKRKKYRESNREKLTESRRKYQKKTKIKQAEYSRNWRKRNPERAKEVFNKWAKANPDKVKANNKNYAIKYRAKVCEKANRRYAKKLNAMPKWLTKEHINQIKEIYEECARQTAETGVEYNVDHIIPLQSDFICGLHVPWNLRIITKIENVKKGNKVIDVN